jgi:hypothetical protein
MLATALLASQIPALPAVSAQDSRAVPLPGAGIALAPGRYQSDLVGPVIDFEVGEGWVVGTSGPGPIFTLELADTPGAVLSVTRFDGQTYTDSCDPTSMTDVDPSADRLAAIIAGDPYFNVAPAKPVEVSGFAGQSLDLSVPPYTECKLQYLLIWALPVGDGGEFVQVAFQQSRFVMLDVDGTTVVIAMETFPGVPFGPMLDASMALLSTMQITPGSGPGATPSAEPTPPATPLPTPEPIERNGGVG